MAADQQCPQATQVPALRALVLLAALAVLGQLALGITTILTSRELITMTVHSSLGAALLASLVAAYWIACPSAPPAPSAVARVGFDLNGCASIEPSGLATEMSETQIAPFSGAHQRKYRNCPRQNWR